MICDYLSFQIGYSITSTEIQKFHGTLSNHLQSLKPTTTPTSNPNHPSSSTVSYEYIGKSLKSDLKRYLLSFVPEPSEYQSFSDLYIKCTNIVLQFYFKSPSSYFKELLHCIHALLGFEPPPYQCEIFARPQYQNQQKNGEKSFQFVQPVLPSKSTRSGYKKKGRNNNMPLVLLTSRTQLCVLDQWFANLKFIEKQLRSQNPMKRIGVFHLQKLLLILYNSGKNAKPEVQRDFYGQRLQKAIEQWVNQLDEESFNTPFLGDDLTHFTQLFGTMEEVFDKFVKRYSSNHIQVDQDLLNIKLVFASRLLRCDKMERRVQSMSLMKIVLDRARSDDNKYKNSGNDNEWSTTGKSRNKSGGKSKGNKSQRNQRNQAYQQGTNQKGGHSTNQKPVSGMRLRNQCSDFLLDSHNDILRRLTSTHYVHENLLTRMQPIVDVLCETDKMNFSTIKLLYEASREKHSIELTQFNKLYLSLSKQLPSSLCAQFWDKLIERRLKDYKLIDQIDESHLEFVSQFVSNYIDGISKNKPKNAGNPMNFGGIIFLKQYAIELEDGGNIITRIELRRYALQQLVDILLTKQLLKQYLNAFIFEILKHFIHYVDQAKVHDDEQERLASGQYQRAPPRLHTGVDPVDITYIIEGVRKLIMAKRIGCPTEQTMINIYNQIQNGEMEKAVRGSYRSNQIKTWIGWMVDELIFWYWYCSPLGWAPANGATNKEHSRWLKQRKSDLKARFTFITMIAQYTPNTVNQLHVEMLSQIPTRKSSDSFYRYGGGGTMRFDGTDIRRLLLDELKTWENQCVQMTQKTAPGRGKEIVDKDAIKLIFLEQFDPNMNINAFKSWLTYFKNINCQYCSNEKSLLGTYTAVPEDVMTMNRKHPFFVGYSHMWDVIEKSVDQDVVVKMMDELVKV